MGGVGVYKNKYKYIPLTKKISPIKLEPNMTYKNRLATKSQKLHITSDDDANLKREAGDLIKKQVILVHTLRQVIASCERQEPHALILAMIGDMLDMDEPAVAASEADPAGVALPPIVTEDKDELM